MKSTRRICYICKTDYDVAESKELRNEPIIQSISIETDSGEFINYPICHKCGNICNIIMNCLKNNDTHYTPN